MYKLKEIALYARLTNFIYSQKGMVKRMTILYEIEDSLYLNLTNKCPCECIFCIRNNGEGAYGSDSLWLEKDPTAAQTIAELKEKDLDSYKEIIFCGFGEPLEALDILIEISKYLKENTKTPIRINTNGLSDLIHSKETAHLLEDLIDIVSISLNAGSVSEYMRVSQPSFGKPSFEAMLKFAEDCKKYIKDVKFTVVDVISPEEIERCKEIAEKMGIELRIRKYQD